MTTVPQIKASLNVPLSSYSSLENVVKGGITTASTSFSTSTASKMVDNRASVLSSLKSFLKMLPNSTEKDKIHCEVCWQNWPRSSAVQIKCLIKIEARFDQLCSEVFRRRIRFPIKL